MSAATLLASTTLGTTYHLRIAEVGAGGPRRLVIVLDGDDQFQPALDAARELDASGVMPPLLLVGVGYGGGYGSPRNLRGRDYTPTRLADESMEHGGAAAFHAFLADELVPWLAARHDLVADDLGLVGYSLGALFVLHAAFLPRPLFRRCLAGSPSIWWDDRFILGALAFQPTEVPPVPQRLFLSVGEEDSPSMIGDFTVFTGRLAREPRPGIVHMVEFLPGLDHFNAVPTALNHGLRWLYGA